MSYYLNSPLSTSSIEFRSTSVHSSISSVLDSCESDHEPDDWKPKEWWDIGGFGSVANSV